LEGGHRSSETIWPRRPSIENSEVLYQRLPSVGLSASEMIRDQLALEANEAFLGSEPSCSRGREADGFTETVNRRTGLAELVHLTNRVLFLTPSFSPLARHSF